MNNVESPAVPSEDDFLDLDPVLRPVAEKYGRPLFALCMNSGMAAEASRILANVTQKHASRAGTQAVSVLVTAYNQIASAYAEQIGVGAGLMEQCNRDIQRAWATKVVVPGSAIILPQ